MKLLLTGPPRVGKTTIVKSVCQKWQDKGYVK
ncbi:MAG: AAA family ATPase [Candidatus Desulfofervidaceae bacterium]|nr:AAA family ATPase [Candidatus Desulfofervidaceae bacterium]